MFADLLATVNFQPTFAFLYKCCDELWRFCSLQQHTLSLDLSAKVLLADVAVEHRDVSKFKSKSQSGFVCRRTCVYWISYYPRQRLLASVCLSVCCLFVRALKGKRLELSAPNLVHIYSITVARLVLTHKSKVQGHTVKKTVMVAWLLVACAATAVCCCRRRGSACRYDHLCFLFVNILRSIKYHHEYNTMPMLGACDVM